MSNNTVMPGPVAIGGVGGSGTRVIAEILIRTGFYLGSDLNAANDNLWFTLLLKRPRLFSDGINGNKAQISKGISIFERAMTAGLKPGADEFYYIMMAAAEMMFKGHDYLGSGRGLWPLKRAATLLCSKKPDASKYIGWGWKEPNTHIYMEFLNKHFKHLKYIHLVRHGIDMAYSSNHAQLYNWGMMFGIEAHNASIPLPKRLLKYWIAANGRAVTLGREILKERFTVINFDELCLDPVRHIDLLIDFLGLKTNCVNVNELKWLLKLPESKDRYKKHDLSIFDKGEINAVRDLGFAVDP